LIGGGKEGKKRQLGDGGAGEVICAYPTFDGHLQQGNAAYHNLKLNKIEGQ
jgi:hypothetical protein